MEQVKIKKPVRPKLPAKPKSTGKKDFSNSDDLCKHIAELSNGIGICSFSRGKDSIGAWIQMKKYFETVIPVYLYRVPGLKFVDESIKYFENEVFHQHCFRLPHPATLRQLNAFMFQPPTHIQPLLEYGFPKLSYDDVFKFLKEDEGLPQSTFVGTGVRANDSPLRATSIKTHGAANYGRHQFFPVYDWTTPYLMEQITANKIKLPVDYDLFGRSFDGIQELYLTPIKEHYPEDYEKIIELFPLAELEVLRIQYRKEWHETH